MLASTIKELLKTKMVRHVKQIADDEYESKMLLLKKTIITV